MDIDGHPPNPTLSSCQFLVQRILMYFFVIVGSTLPGLFEALHIFQVDIGGHPPVSTGSSCQFLVQHVLLYFYVIVGSTLLWMSKSLHIF